MSYALRERSRAAFPCAVGEAGRWAMDGTADRTQLLSVWRQQWNNGTQWRLSERKNVGEQRGISLSNIPPLSSLLQCLNLLQSDRERGLSVLMKAYLPDAEYTPLPTQGVDACKWLTERHTPSTSNPGQNCRLVWVILALWHHSAERCHDSLNPHRNFFFRFHPVASYAVPNRQMCIYECCSPIYCCGLF